MGIVPGVEPDHGVSQPPLLNEDPVPPGVEDLSEDVDEIESRVRGAGPAEVERADEQADAVEGDAEHEERGDAPDGVEPGTRSDAANDPTTDDPAVDTPA